MGRRFKPDLGHQRVDISAPGGRIRCGHPPARSIRGRHEGVNGDAKTRREDCQFFGAPLCAVVETVGDRLRQGAEEGPDVSARQSTRHEVLRECQAHSPIEGQLCSCIARFARHSGSFADERKSCKRKGLRRFEKLYIFYT